MCANLVTFYKKCLTTICHIKDLKRHIVFKALSNCIFKYHLSLLDYSERRKTKILGIFLFAIHEVSV